MTDTEKSANSHSSRSVDTTSNSTLKSSKILKQKVNDEISHNKNIEEQLNAKSVVSNRTSKSKFQVSKKNNNKQANINQLDIGPAAIAIRATTVSSSLVPSSNSIKTNERHLISGNKNVCFFSSQLEGFFMFNLFLKLRKCF